MTAVETRIDLENPVVLWPHFLDAASSATLFNRCRDTLEWHAETFSIFGRTIEVPRRVAWVGDRGLDYRYAARSHEGAGWPAWLTPTRAAISRFGDCALNHVVFNLYRHGNDHMGWHRDDETGVAGPVWVLSLGTSRRLRYRKGPGTPATTVKLDAGSLLRLDGRVQHTLLRDSTSRDERISLSFRNLTDVNMAPALPLQRRSRGE